MDDVKSLICDLNKVLVGDLRERAGRIIEELSHPKHVTAGDVAQLIAEIQSELSKRFIMNPGEPYRVCQGLLRQASEMIVELSREKSGDVAQLIAEIQGIRKLVSRSHESTDSSTAVLGFCDSGLFAKLLDRAVEMIVQLSREKLITGSIHGGVLTLDDLPLGVRVEVRDYDVEGLDDKSILEDEDGHYAELVWGH